MNKYSIDRCIPPPLTELPPSKLPGVLRWRGPGGWVPGPTTSQRWRARHQGKAEFLFSSFTPTERVGTDSLGPPTGLGRSGNWFTSSAQHICSAVFSFHSE